MSLAFNGYIIHVSRPDQFKAMVSVNASVVNLCNITEPRKSQLKAEILHNLKEF